MTQQFNTLQDLIHYFYDFNIANAIEYGSGKGPTISAVIVYEQSNFDKPYSETQRSYRVTNHDGKAFFPGLIGNSIFADCLDPTTDQGVRLDYYYKWKIERIYLEEAV